MHSNNAIKSLFKCYLLNGKTFQINISKYLQKILCWRITFLTRQCNGGITDELFWVEVIQYYIVRPQATTHWEASEPSPCPRQPPAASPVFIKFELGLKSVIRCLISGNRTHRIIPVQTTSPLPGDVTKLITTVEDGGEVSPFRPWSGAAWTLMTKDMLHLVRKCWVV